MTTFSPHPAPLAGPRLMRQVWADLTFVHWAVDPDRVAHLLPRGTVPDELGGATYVGLIPFRMQQAGFGRGPAIPYLGDFAETNVRLYSVDGQGRHGVVFRSLETSRLVAAVGARLAFATPYTWARMRIDRRDDVVDYTTRRRWPGPRGAGGRLTARIGDRITDPSELDLFLTARFGLHTRWAGQTLWIPNHHEPWPLRQADLLHLDDSLVAAAGLPGLVDVAPASVLHADPVRTVFGLPQRVRT
ncbi:YqjF family protein [Aeromicrobium marinum]|uniref:YqjF family protein n=1 Tax=Aeromicrobium marinum TaxID=219314 RepID=UPI00058DC719|nr:DUF2071 domain-containing protein [Aeromicrobium marinum]